MNADRLLSTGQVAKRLGIAVRTVYRWEKAGKLHPARLPSGQRRVSAREVEVLDGPVATDAAQELVQDMLAIVTCFAMKLYCQRAQRFRQKVRAAMKEAEGLG